MRNFRLEYFYKTYYFLVYRIAFLQLKNHCDAEDVCQEVFIRLLRSNPVFECGAHEKAWLMRVTINICRDLCKSKYKQTTVPLDYVPETERRFFALPAADSDDTLWAVMALPEDQKNCLYLFYYEDYSIREISGYLNMPENTVKTNLRRGRAALKKALEMRK